MPETNMEVNPLLNAALDYAARGMAVFPVTVYFNPKRGKYEKRPLTKNGHLDATTDAAVVRAWWEAWPNAGIGYRPGRGVFLSDADTKPGGANGIETLRRLEAEHGALPKCPRVRTPSGGLHLHLSKPEDRHVSIGANKALGLDWRADGNGWAVLPPTTSEDGQAKYEWEIPLNGSLPPAPAWLLDLARPETKTIELAPLNIGHVGIDIDAEIERAKAGEWHDAMVRVTAALCGPREMTDEQIITYLLGRGVTLDGYSDADTRRDLQVMINGARAKFGPVIRIPAIETSEVRTDLQKLPPRLPDAFWERLPWLTTIRDIGDAMLVPPDTVLAAVVARYGSMLPIGSGFASGLVSQVSTLNMFVASIGLSGAGKTTASAAARSMLDETRAPADWIEGCPATGEGIAEAFYGSVEVEGSNGKPKYVRERVRNNVYLFEDEGKRLHEIAERGGQTMFSVIRSLISGATIGGLAATQERTRIVNPPYCASLFIGYQPSTVQALLQMDGDGTLQRVWFVSAHYPYSDDGCAATTAPTFYVPKTATVIQFPEWVRKYLRACRVARERDPDNAQAGHENILRCKLASLLILMHEEGNNRRLDFEVAWDLAGTMVDTSREITEWCIDFGRRAREDEIAAKSAEYASRAAASKLASMGAVDALDRLRKKFVAAADKLAPGQYMTRKTFRWLLRDPVEIGLIDQALALCVNEGELQASPGQRGSLRYNR